MTYGEVSGSASQNYVLVVCLNWFNVGSLGSFISVRNWIKYCW